MRARGNAPARVYQEPLSTTRNKLALEAEEVEQVARAGADRDVARTGVHIAVHERVLEAQKVNEIERARTREGLELAWISVHSIERELRMPLTYTAEQFRYLPLDAQKQRV